MNSLDSTDDTQVNSQQTELLCCGLFFMRNMPLAITP